MCEPSRSEAFQRIPVITSDIVAQPSTTCSHRRATASEGLGPLLTPTPRNEQNERPQSGVREAANGGTVRERSQRQGSGGRDDIIWGRCRAWGLVGPAGGEVVFSRAGTVAELPVELRRLLDEERRGPAW